MQTLTLKHPRRLPRNNPQTPKLSQVVPRLPSYFHSFRDLAARPYQEAMAPLAGSTKDRLGFRLWGFGFMVWGLGFRLWGLGFRLCSGLGGGL